MSEGGGAAADQSVWSFGFSPKIDHHRILPNTYYTLPTTYMQTFILLHYCILTKHAEEANLNTACSLWPL